MSDLFEVNSELKTENCPFCGSLQIREGNDKVTIGKAGKMFYVFCYQCSTYGPVAFTVDEAIKYWNERPLEDAMQKHIAELEAQVAILCPIGDLSALETWMVEKQTYMESISALEKERNELMADNKKLRADYDMLGKLYKCEIEKTFLPPEF